MSEGEVVKVAERAVVPVNEGEVLPVVDAGAVGAIEDALMGGGEVSSAVDVLKATITAPKDGSVDTLLMVSNISVPEVVAVLFAKADWCDRVSNGRRGRVRRGIGKYLVECEVGRRGEDNRAGKVISASEMGLRAEFEIKKSMGNRLMGQ